MSAASVIGDVPRVLLDEANLTKFVPVEKQDAPGLIDSLEGKTSSDAMDREHSRSTASKTDHSMDSETVRLEEDKDKGASKTSKKFIDEDSKDPTYRSDEWRMKHFKVIPCAKRYAHDWTICPFAHPGEKARRRDPAVFPYAGIACPEMKKAGFCSKGDQCSYAHNVFEYWMHPARYRTQLCNDGTSCARHVCFFAHTAEEVRSTALTKATAAVEKKEGLLDMDVSPDGPFSLNTQASGRSSMSGQRSLSLSPEERIANGHGGMDYTSARQHRGGSRQDISQMFTRLLHNPSQEAAQVEAKDENSPEYEAQVLQAMRALDFHEAQLLLKLARAQVKQQAESMNRRESETLHLFDKMQDGQNTPLQMNHMDSGMRPRLSPHVSPLHTAPAGMHLADPGQSGGLNYARLLSGDMSAMYSTPQWQSGGLRRYSNHLADMSRAPSSNVIARMSMEPHLYASMPLMGNTGLYQTSSSTSSHNPSALHSQPFRLDDVTAQIGHTNPKANQSLTTPVPSAFQQLASQEWKTTPGRGVQAADNMNWRYSGNTPSGDLTSISEDMASSHAEINKLRQQQDMAARQYPAPWDSRNRGVVMPGAGAPESDFDYLQVPLNATNQIPVAPKALHPGTFDLTSNYGLPPTNNQNTSWMGPGGL